MRLCKGNPVKALVVLLSFLFSSSFGLSFQCKHISSDSLQNGIPQPVYCIATDLDSDGDIDFVVNTNHGVFGGTLYWLQNMGNGKYDRHVICADIIMDKIDAVDIDKDGDVDLITYGTTLFDNSSTINATIELINDGNQEFSRKAIVPAYPWAILDAENDGDMDIVAVPRDSSKFKLYRNLGNGSFTVDSIYHNFYPEWLNTIDANKDGFSDLYCYSSDSGKGMFLMNQGNGTFSMVPAAINLGVSSFANDLDNDGDADIVYLEYNNTMHICENRGGSFTIPGTTVLLPSVDIIACDLDHDGMNDLIPQRLSSTYLNGSGNLPVFPWCKLSKDFGAEIRKDSVRNQRYGDIYLTPIDFDNDGDIDLVETVDIFTGSAGAIGQVNVLLSDLAPQDIRLPDTIVHGLDSTSITWSGSYTGLLKILFSSDSGTTWQTMADSVPNSGTYRWYVTQAPSCRCRICVVDSRTGELGRTSYFSFSIQDKTVVGQPAAHKENTAVFKGSGKNHDVTSYTLDGRRISASNHGRMAKGVIINCQLSNKDMPQGKKSSRFLAVH